MDIDKHIHEITKLRKLADQYIEDNPHNLMEKIGTLSKCLVFIGRVSSVLDGDYKRIYAKRKHEFALAVTKATKDKQAHAELAVSELRQQEAEAYEIMQRWRNAFDSTKEEINALKLKMRIDLVGGNDVSIKPLPQAAV